jgi:hypothetical protein
MNYEHEVQGTAVYLELRKHGFTTQVIVTPDGFGATEGLVSSTFFRRTLSSHESRKKWRAYVNRLDSMTEKYILELQDPTTSTSLKSEYNSQLSKERVVARYKPLHEYISNMNSKGYKLVKDTPIYIEITKEDLSQISTGSLPTKVWSRVKSSRIALGFPENLVTTDITEYI